jgi:hypothetical protein
MKVLLHALDGEESLMSAKPLMLLVPAATTAGPVLGPAAADAAEMHQPGTWGMPAGPGVRVSNLTRGGMPGGVVHVPQMILPHISSKTINIYKPVTITGTIDASRNTSSPRISTIRKPSTPRSMSRSTSRRRPKGAGLHRAHQSAQMTCSSPMSCVSVWTPNAR